jgi:hypothetical protein
MDSNGASCKRNYLSQMFKNCFKSREIKGTENNMNLWEYTGPLGQKKPSNAGFTFGIAPRRETLQWIESILSPGWA